MRDLNGMMLYDDDNNREFGRKKPKLPNEYEELTEYDRYVRVADVTKASGIPKLQKTYTIIVICVMSVIFIATLIEVFLGKSKTGMAFGMCCAMEINAAIAFLPIYFMKRSALPDLLDVNKRKIILKDDVLIYSNVTTVRRYGGYRYYEFLRKTGGTYHYMYEYTIPYENIIKISHDTKNFKYRIECSEYTAHSIGLKGDEKKSGYIDIIDLFEDPNLFQKIAVKSVDNTITGGSIAEEELPITMDKSVLIFECVASVVLLAFSCVGLLGLIFGW